MITKKIFSNPSGLWHKQVLTVINLQMLLVKTLLQLTGNGELNNLMSG